jgi:hypothetical protein
MNDRRAYIYCLKPPTPGLSMRMIQLSRAFALVSFLAVSACASGGTSEETAAPEPGGAGGTSATLVIENNRPNASAITVFIEPEVGGTRASLGTVEPNTTGRFTYNASVTGNYRLIAQQASGGGDIRTSAFRLQNGQIATWNMQVSNRPLVKNR